MRVSSHDETFNKQQQYNITIFPSIVDVDRILEDVIATNAKMASLISRLVNIVVAASRAQKMKFVINKMVNVIARRTYLVQLAIVALTERIIYKIPIPKDVRNVSVSVKQPSVTVHSCANSM